MKTGRRWWEGVQERSSEGRRAHGGRFDQGGERLRRAVRIAILLLGGSATGLPAELEERPTPRPEPQPRAVETPVAEDGTPYPADPMRARAEWQLGKIQPAVIDEAAVRDEVDVIIYLSSAPGPSPAEVKAPYEDEIESPAQQLREMDTEYRPPWPLRQDEERTLSLLRQLALSDEDQARRRELSLEIDRKLSRMRAAVYRSHRQRVTPDQAVLTRYVEDQGGRVNANILVTNALDATVPASALETIAGHPLVTTITLRPILRDMLNVSVPSAQYTAWHAAPFLIDGGVYDVGVIDSGLQGNHPAFAGIPFFTDGSPLADAVGHGTHVTGIIASRDSTFLGTAFGLDKVFFAHRDGVFAAFEGLMSIGATSDTPETINYSQGFDVATDTDYSSDDSFYDAFIESYNVMIAQAAGNEGWGTTTIVHPAPAYNSLVVANMNDRGTTTRTDDLRANSSSVGPTLNGRWKPDITAPGTNIRSTHANWQFTSPASSCSANRTADNDFANCTGTSMAAPHVAGAIVLMEDGGNNSPIAQKAVLLNTADWWTSSGTSGTADDGPVTNTSGYGVNDWDPSYGWGYIDMSEALFNRADYFVRTLLPRNPQDDDYRLFAGPMLANERATMVWQKRGIYNGASAPTTTFALSDLNLRLYDEADGSLDDIETSGANNVHQVAAPSSVDAVIKAYAWSTSFAGVGTEQFALATEENFVEVAFPETFGAFSSRPSTVQPLEQFTYQFRVTNQSQIASHQNTFTLTLPAGWTLVSGSLAQNVGSVAAGATSPTATWTIQAGGTPQNDVILQTVHSHSSYAESFSLTHLPTIDVVQDVTPPTPNPMLWIIEPFELSTSSIRMTAWTAIDAHGPVEYYHDFTGSSTGGAGGTDSGWTTALSYTDKGLLANHEYCYRIWARDNPTTAPNLTSPSAISCDYTDIQTPTGITFGTIKTSSIAARSTNTPSNLTFGSSGLLVQNVTNGANSGWRQNNVLWTSGGLSPNTLYDFRAEARNGDASITPWSPISGRHTLANPPVSGSLSVVTDDTTLRATWSDNGNPPGTEYLAENLTAGTNSGWTTSTFWDSTGLTCGASYTVQVRARNGDGVQTAAVTIGTATAGFDFEGDGIPDCVDADDDDDGVSDPSDCAPFDVTLWAVPSETQGITVGHGGGVTTLAWGGPAAPGTSGTVFYDLILSSSASLWVPPDASCLESGDVNRAATHTSDPALGEVLSFVARPENGCGNGDPGAGQDVPGGAPIPRTVMDCN